MNLSRAMAVAADGLTVEKAQLRTIARTLESEQRGVSRRRPATGSSADLDPDAQWRQESTLALQASRRLLARTIDMLG